MTLVKWNTPRNLNSYDTAFNRLMNDVFTGFNMQPADQNQGWTPRVDISESTDNFVATVELPGVDKNDLSINVKEGVLSIKGEKKAPAEQEGVNYHRVERSYGEFNREFRLSKNIVADKINAEFTNGVLTLTLPKAEEAKPREIEVKIS